MLANSSPSPNQPVAPDCLMTFYAHHWPALVARPDAGSLLNEMENGAGKVIVRLRALTTTVQDSRAPAPPYDKSEKRARGASSLCIPGLCYVSLLDRLGVLSSDLPSAIRLTLRGCLTKLSGEPIAR